MRAVWSEEGREEREEREERASRREEGGRSGLCPVRETGWEGGGGSPRPNTLSLAVREEERK